MKELYEIHNWMKSIYDMNLIYTIENEVSKLTKDGQITYPDIKITINGSVSYIDITPSSFGAMYRLREVPWGTPILKFQRRDKTPTPDELKQFLISCKKIFTDYTFRRY